MRPPNLRQNSELKNPNDKPLRTASLNFLIALNPVNSFVITLLLNLTNKGRQHNYIDFSLTLHSLSQSHRRQRASFLVHYFPFLMWQKLFFNGLILSLVPYNWTLESVKIIMNLFFDRLDSDVIHDKRHWMFIWLQWRLVLLYNQIPYHIFWWSIDSWWLWILLL